MTTDDDRTGHASQLGELARDLMRGDEPTLGYSDAWWEQRDREIAAERAKDVASTEAIRIAERAGELEDNGFPPMAIETVRGQLEETTAMRFARLFVSMADHGLRKRLLVLAGGVGTGKTTAATYVAMQSRDPRPAFIRIAELERRGRYDRNLSEWLSDKTSLVIDDVGAEVLDGKGVFRSLLDEIIDKFYSGRRVLVMTTNLRPRKARKGEPGYTPDELEQFAERYGERVTSRIGQLGEWGDCGTRDLRKELRS